ncbi:Polyadenylate-binding protein/Hyperplastic disc protein [Dioscorea alata]|uniref:Polyadenylate-binding protein/Hyperplastic disc protein n=1 Tax=Dioscorea alata TaxID=55571 RepID=A0ACB7UXL8_DIOAL|nr:Polyadenylate-binding protein/Hyperplastic disc protein [Dioscorea alata]
MEFGVNERKGKVSVLRAPSPITSTNKLLPTHNLISRSMDKELAMNVSDIMKQLIDKIQKIEPDHFQKIAGLVFFLCRPEEMMQCALNSDKLHTKITEIKEILCIPTTNADQDQLLMPESSKLRIQNGDRKIYITFNPESTLTEHDVACYFSQFGTIEDVSIPSNRTYGFVTFSNPESVNSILSNSRPHYIRDSKVFAKQYKHKFELEKKHAEREVDSTSNDPHYLDLLKKLPPDDIFHNYNY